MPHFKKYIILFITLFVVNSLYSQKLTHRLGEVLVEVRDDNGFYTLLKELSIDLKTNSEITYEKILSDPYNIWLLRIDPTIDNETKFLNVVIKNSNTLLAQKNRISELRATIPNDPLFMNQWQYINLGQSGGVEGADIDMDLAWDHTTGGLTADGDTIVACVIDVGILENNVDLDDNLWINHSEIPNNNIDDDGNGYVDDYLGWNSIGDDGDIYSIDSHGNSCAGVIGAKGNNMVGVAGVNWDVKVMVVKGRRFESEILQSYAYPLKMRKLYNETNGEKGAFVVCTSSSFGITSDPEESPLWCDFYNEFGEVGILNFGATVNDDLNIDEVGDVPTGCKSDYLVSVTNVRRNDELDNSAGFGERGIDLGAFGSSAYTLVGSAYGGWGGTSAATPQAAGVAALLYSTSCTGFNALVKSNPSQAALLIKDCILHGVDPNETLMGITTTDGRLNANNAMLNLLSLCDNCTPALGAHIADLTNLDGKLVWSETGNIGEVSLRYRALGAVNWIEENDISSGFELSGLMGCTEYEYQLRSDCPNVIPEGYTYPRVFKTDGCCDIPDDVEINVEGTQAVINWDNVLLASEFILEYKRSVDSEWNIVSIDGESSYIIQDIQACEPYDFRVKSLCGSLSIESEYTQTFIVSGDCGVCTEDYCSFGIKDVSDEWIQSVSIEDVFTNESGPHPQGYDNFVDNFGIVLKTEEEYKIILSPGHAAALFNEFFIAYIDYNQDQVFSDNEILYRDEVSTLTTVEGLFTIPESALMGVTRMRIIMRYNQMGEGCDNGFQFGEIEDYCVTIDTGTPTIEDPIKDISIYPNPTNGTIHIHLADQYISEGVVSVYTMNGEKVVKNTIISSANHSLNIGDISAGIYLVRIDLGQETIYKKIVKY